MIKEFMQSKEDFPLGEGKEKVAKGQPLRAMDHQELCRSPLLSSFAESANFCSSEYVSSPSRKRKHYWDESMTQTSIELQLNDPLPLDWEQCLDLQSGRMYYLNRKILKKSWIRPKEQKLDLDLNISPHPTSKVKPTTTQEDLKKHNNHQPSSMVAVACFNCHLLVMLCRSSPSCPNCKFMHTLLPSPPTLPPMKSLETLSLLH